MGNAEAFVTSWPDNLVFVDCEAAGDSAWDGTLTEYGAVHYATRQAFHGRLFEGHPDPASPAVPIPSQRVAWDHDVAGIFASWIRQVVPEGRPVFVSDNPAYDWQWIAAHFAKAGRPNPFGHSGRRISDFWAGLQGDWRKTQGWKKLRKTPHDHNPVNDAMGNVEAFAAILRTIEERS